jgi:hypothetical protein
MNEVELQAARQRAYQIWEQDGHPEGEHESHWHRALKELGLEKPFDEERTEIAVQARQWDEEEGQQ